MKLEKSSLPINSRLSDKCLDLINIMIDDLNEEIEYINDREISYGGTSKGSKSYFSLYIQYKNCPTHNPNSYAYNDYVLGKWTFKIKDKYGFKFMGIKHTRELINFIKDIY